MNHSLWHLLPPIPDQHLVHESGLPPLIVQLLYNRGITELTQLKSFLASDRSLSYDPFLLPDMHQAVTRIYQALLSGENIAIFGDFDADGITATALLVQGLSALGGKISAYIPHRQNEGHGLSINALRNLSQQGISLVITVDCGITNLDEVKRARKLGLDIAITDHHTPPPEIPPALAVVDPKLARSIYPFTGFSGVGVAFKLLQAILQSIGKEEQLNKLTDLVAIGTIADMSPLLAENRYLVKEGLKLMNDTPRLGIKELMLQTGINPGSINADKISWTIAPRLNASGRLADALGGYRLMLTESTEEAQELAAWLDKINSERQSLTSTAFARAREQVLAKGISPLLIVGDEDYHLGVAGLVASRLVEEFCRPSIVIKTGKRVSNGSCRSISAFNIVAALTECRELFTQFGGHSQAAGFTIPTKNLSRLEQQLSEIAATQLDGVDLRPHIDIDALVSLPELGGDTFCLTQQLAPFGQGNPPPTFLSRAVEVLDCRTMGNDGSHLRLKLRQNGTVWDGVGFNLGGYLPEVSSHLDIVYNLEMDSWRGNERLRLNLIDIMSSK
ncbi:single-stranded-DNA-specific exonuclease RecJ [Chloroflexota bacterium]